MLTENSLTSNFFLARWGMHTPAQIERFLDLNFLVVRREEAQGTECWCPDETVKQELVALGWPEKGF